MSCLSPSITLNPFNTLGRASRKTTAMLFDTLQSDVAELQKELNNYESIVDDLTSRLDELQDKLEELTNEWIL